MALKDWKKANDVKKEHYINNEGEDVFGSWINWRKKKRNTRYSTSVPCTVTYGADVIYLHKYPWNNYWEFSSGSEIGGCAGDSYIIEKRFKTKKEAVKFAMDFMRKY